MSDESVKALAGKIAEALLPHESEERRRFGALALVLPLLIADQEARDASIQVRLALAEDAVALKSALYIADERLREKHEIEADLAAMTAERDCLVLQIKDDGELLDRIAALEAALNEAREALAEAAVEINCAGPVAHRIRIMKQEHSTALTEARAEIERLKTELAEIDGLDFGGALMRAQDWRIKADIAIARVAELQALTDDCEREHPPEPEYLAWPKERAVLEARLREARGLLSSAMEWTAGYPLQGPESYADRHAADYLYAGIDAFLAPDAPTAEPPMSRSRLKREAIQRGEPMPTFAPTVSEEEGRIVTRMDRIEQIGQAILATVSEGTPRERHAYREPCGREDCTRGCHTEVDYLILCGKSESDSCHTPAEHTMRCRHASCKERVSTQSGTGYCAVHAPAPEQEKPIRCFGCNAVLTEGVMVCPACLPPALEVPKGETPEPSCGGPGLCSCGEASPDRLVIHMKGQPCRLWDVPQPRGYRNPDPPKPDEGPEPPALCGTCGAMLVSRYLTHCSKCWIEPAPAPEVPKGETPDAAYCLVRMDDTHDCGNLRPCPTHAPKPDEGPDPATPESR